MQNVVMDENLIVKTNIGKDDVKFFNAKKAPFKIYGLIEENGRFRRMPDEIAKEGTPGFLSHNTMASGGRVRFKTDSHYIAISAKLGKIGRMPHFALTGSAGFDMYADGKYAGTFVPPYDMVDGYESVLEFEDSKMRDIIINFPLYSEVIDLYVGIKEGSVLSEGNRYKHTTPVVYYGASITQGGCASRAGNSYPGFISRALDTDFVNLGYSGNCYGEKAFAEYIKDLKMSVFVFDYDGNARTAEHLKNTHEPFFKIVREKNPDLPIIFMTRPYEIKGFEHECRQIVEETYQNALKSGDKNVYFVPGEKLTEGTFGEGNCDGKHCTDFGFYRMAQALIPVLEKLL